MSERLREIERQIQTMQARAAERDRADILHRVREALSERGIERGQQFRDLVGIITPQVKYAANGRMVGPGGQSVESFVAEQCASRGTRSWATASNTNDTCAELDHAGRFQADLDEIRPGMSKETVDRVWAVIAHNVKEQLGQR